MKLKYFFAIIICSLSFSSCKKKYEEDPRKTCKSPNTRLSGQWKLVDYTFNGNSIISQLNGLNQKFDIRNIIFNYTEENKNEYALEISDAITVHYKYYNPLVNGDSDFQITSFGSEDSICNQWFITPFKYVRPAEALWHITKLFKKEFHLKLNTDSGEYKLILKK